MNKNQRLQDLIANRNENWELIAKLAGQLAKAWNNDDWARWEEKGILFEEVLRKELSVSRRLRRLVLDGPERPK